MRRLWIYAIGIVLVILALTVIILAFSNSKEHNGQKPTESTTTNLPLKKACTIFTLADAEKVLGGNAKGGDNTPTPSSDDLAVSSCSYTPDTGSQVASLLARAPKTGKGIISNRNQFGSLKPADVQPVSGYGDSAYWDPRYGQLNIFKNSTWYILSNGPITPADRILDEAKQLANLLIGKL